MMESDGILIMGIGNVLMGDEGIGVHAIKHLGERAFPENVHLLDGGTGGFHLLSHLQEHPTVIMIDATMDGKPAGTVDLKRPRFAKDFPRVLSAHDIGLKDLIDAAIFSGNLPEIHLITVSIKDLDKVTVELTSEVEASLSEVEKMVSELLTTLLKNQNTVLN